MHYLKIPIFLLRFCLETPPVVVPLGVAPQHLDLPLLSLMASQRQVYVKVIIGNLVHMCTLIYLVLET